MSMYASTTAFTAPRWKWNTCWPGTWQKTYQDSMRRKHIAAWCISLTLYVIFMLFFWVQKIGGPCASVSGRDNSSRQYLWRSRSSAATAHSSYQEENQGKCREVKHQCQLLHGMCAMPTARQWFLWIALWLTSQVSQIHECIVAALCSQLYCFFKVYDFLLNIALQQQGCMRKNLIIDGPWKWLLENFAEQYSLRAPYVQLAYLKWIMKWE